MDTRANPTTVTAAVGVKANDVPGTGFTVGAATLVNPWTAPGGWSIVLSEATESLTVVSKPRPGPLAMSATTIDWPSANFAGFALLAAGPDGSRKVSDSALCACLLTSSLCVGFPLVSIVGQG